MNIEKKYKTYTILCFGHSSRYLFYASNIILGLLRHNCLPTQFFYTLHIIFLIDTRFFIIEFFEYLKKN